MGCLKPRIQYFKKIINILIKTMTCSCRSRVIYQMYIVILIMILSWITLAQIHNYKLKSKPYQRNNKLVLKNSSPFQNHETPDVVKNGYGSFRSKADERCERYYNVPYFRVPREDAIGLSKSFGRDSDNHLIPDSRDPNGLSRRLTSSRDDKEPHLSHEEAPWERDSGIPLLTLNELYTANATDPNASISPTHPTDAPPQIDNVKMNANAAENSTLTPSDFVLITTTTDVSGKTSGPAVVFEETTEIPSFNEWKQIMMVERGKASNTISNGATTKEETGEGNVIKGGGVGGTGIIQHQETQHKNVGFVVEGGKEQGGPNGSLLPPHPSQINGVQPGLALPNPTPTRPPNMNNYGSLDCGAKILHHNAEAVNAGGILNRNLDEYMLNPCSATIWFTFELCEPIQVKSIEIANLELFSSSPKEIRVHISDRYPTREWLTNMTFLATDERRVQAFPLHHTMFARYIKVELLSHYGHEHYCPLTLIRVYGTSMIDEYDNDAILDQSAHDTASAILDQSAHDTASAILDQSAAALTPQDVPGEPPTIFSPNDSTTGLNRFEPIGTLSEPEMSNGNQRKAEGYEHAPAVEEYDPAATGLQGAGLLGPRNILISAKDAVLNIFNHATNVLTPPNFNAPLRTRKLFNITLSDDHNETKAFEHSDLSLTLETTPPAIDPLSSVNESSSQNNAISEEGHNNKMLTKAGTVPEDRTPSIAPIPHINDTVLIASRKPITSKAASMVSPLKPKINIFIPLKALPYCKAPRPNYTYATSTSSTPTEAPLTPQDSPGPIPTPQASGGGVVASHKESIFMRLNNRIKTLELNVSLSGRYLEELSKRYRKQMEDMAAAFNRTARALNETARVADIRYARHETIIEEMKSSLITLSSLVQECGTTQRETVSVRSPQWPLLIMCVALLAVLQIALTYYVLYRLVPRRVAQILAAAASRTSPPNGLVTRGGPLKNGGRHISRATLEDFGETGDLIPIRCDHKLESPMSSSPCQSTNLEVHLNAEEIAQGGTTQLVPSSPSFTLARPKKKRKKLVQAIRQSSISWNDPRLPWPRVILLPSFNRHLQVARSFKHSHSKSHETFENAQFFGPQFFGHAAKAKAGRLSLPPSCSRNHHRYNNCRFRKYSHPSFEYA